ncbi:Aa_trans domain-containing protein [Haematococcus lacustris]|uniref:Aa_trans domain-containing protein n=1 Tax=Haematococcus lacustris TaxID=44745 RepID=A0A699ZT70_HAELA|nr:Aa_trans domain-containing protein [Haematococcus lacustris]
MSSVWVWRRRKALALLVFGLVSGIACTDAILSAVKEEAVVVQLAQQLAAHEAVVGPDQGPGSSGGSVSGADSLSPAGSSAGKRQQLPGQAAARSRRAVRPATGCQCAAS